MATIFHRDGEPARVEVPGPQNVASEIKRVI